MARSAQADTTSPVRVRLLSSVNQVMLGEPFDLALQFELDPDWHTYWTNPGQAGMPLRVAWHLPRGTETGDLEWPAPQVFLEDGLVVYGFGNSLILPVRVTPPGRVRAGDDQLSIALELEWLVCREVCIPGATRLEWSAPIHETRATPSADADVIDAAREKLPALNPAWTFRARMEGDEVVLLASADGKALSPGLFFASDPGVVRPVAKPRSRPEGTASQALRMQRDPYGPHPPERLRGVWIPATGRAVRVDVPLERPHGGP